MSREGLSCRDCGVCVPGLGEFAMGHLDAFNRELRKQGERQIMPSEVTLCSGCYKLHYARLHSRSDHEFAELQEAAKELRSFGSVSQALMDRVMEGAFAPNLKALLEGRNKNAKGGSNPLD